MSDDVESRRVILSRRARFIAAALASAGVTAVASCSDDSKPQACLSFYGGAGGGDQDAGPDADAGSSSDADSRQDG